MTASPDQATASARRRTHRVAVALLLVIATLLTPVTICALFLKTEISDTSRYVENVAPLGTHPAIQSFIADDLTSRLFASADVRQYVQQALPPRAEPLAGPLTRALETFVREVTIRVLQTDRFQNLWVKTNRAAHTQLVNILTGKSGGALVANPNGVVAIDVSAIVARVQEQLRASGIDLFSKVPIVKIGRQIPIFESKDLYKIRNAVGLLDTLAFVLPFLVFGSFVGAIFLSASRRKGFLLSAICFSLGALALALALAIGRSAYLDAATSRDLPYDAAAAVYDTLVRFLHTSVRAVLTLSLIVITAVFFAGPSRLSVWFRLRCRTTASWLGAQSDAAGVRWLHQRTSVEHHKGLLRIIVAAGAFALLFFRRHPTPAAILTVAIGTLLALAAIEFLGRQPEPPNVPAGVRKGAASLD